MSQSIHDFLSSLGEEIIDAEEESFLLFSRDIPSNNLGFIDSRASTLDITIHDHDYTIHQSPTLLSSTREGGTTGAVVWKITPLFAEWISSHSSSAGVPSNPFWASILSPSATVIELGCGISGLVALALAPLVDSYVATDQEYVRKYFRMNVDENWTKSVSVKKGTFKKSRSRTAAAVTTKSKDKDKDRDTTNISFVPLDWELDIPSNDTLHNSNTNKSGFDLLISCDCIYNESLIPSFVRTCADICLLRSADAKTTTTTTTTTRNETKPTIAIIAQQQRSPDVFETWLRETLRYFRVWRIDDFEEALGKERRNDLGDGSGYVVHALVLRGDLFEE